MSIHNTLLASLLTGLALICAPTNAPATTTTQSALSSSPSLSTSSTPSTVTQKLVGYWSRTDSPQYIIQIKSVNPDGKLDAAYFNPRPIHVAKAELRAKDGKTAIYVEMQDKNYPGSNYNLTFYEAEDALVGKYFQAVEGETYDVAFTRLKK